MNNFPKIPAGALLSRGGHAERPSRSATSLTVPAPRRSAGGMALRYKKHLAALGVIGLLVLGSSPASAMPISEWKSGCIQANGAWSSFRQNGTMYFQCVFTFNWEGGEWYGRTVLDRYGREINFCEGDPNGFEVCRR
ncbi:MAG: hypothetical protein H6R26_703 [Proteobacteria bacterium]|nr:hypothetical protein [Pseudomonadota bacterium]